MIKIINFLKRKNIFASFTIDKRHYTETDTGNFGSLTFTNNTNKYSFLRFIYDNCEDVYMERKYKLAQEFINYVNNETKPSYKEVVLYYEYAVNIYDRAGGFGSTGTK